MAGQPQAVLVVIKASWCGACKAFTSEVWPIVEKEIKNKKFPIRIEIDEDGKNKNVRPVYRTIFGSVPNFHVISAKSWESGELTGIVSRLGFADPGTPQGATKQDIAKAFLQWVYGAYQNALNPPPPVAPSEAPKEVIPDVCSRKMRSRNWR